MSYGLADTLSADSYLASIGDTSSSAPITINMPEEKKDEEVDEVYGESILKDNLYPAGIALVVIFLLTFGLLSSNLVSAHYETATTANRAKFAFFITLFTVFLFAFVYALWRYIRALRFKGMVKPNLNIVWIYGVVLLLLFVLLFTTDFFKS